MALSSSPDRALSAAHLEQMKNVHYLLVSVEQTLIFGRSCFLSAWFRLEYQQDVGDGGKEDGLFEGCGVEENVNCESVEMGLNL